MNSRHFRHHHIVVNVVFLISIAAGICSGSSSFPDGTILSSVTFGNGKFVAAGDYGAIFVSPDGIAWNESVSGTTTDLNAVAFGNNRFVAVGYDGIILLSTDGVTWSKKDSKTTDDFNGVTFGNGLFVAVGSHYAMSVEDYLPVYTSGDGELWTIRSTGVLGGSLDRVAYGNSRFYAEGQIPFITSADGITWATDSLGRKLALFAMTYGNGRWVALASSGGMFSTTKVYCAVGDSAWTNDSTKSVPWNDLNAFGFANDRFIAVSNDSLRATGYYSTMWTSTDGAVWTKQAGGSGIKGYGVPYAMAYGNNTYVLVGSNGFAAASADCITWTSTTLASRNNVVVHRLSNRVNRGLDIRLEHGTVFISTPSRKTSQPAIVRLFNAAGKMVFSASALEVDGKVHVRIGNIPSGIYVVKLIGQNRVDVSAPFLVMR